AREPARWRGFRSVMCAVDFSERSRQALRYAEAVARRGLGTLTVLYANDPLLVAAAAAALRDGDLVKRSAAELDAFVDETLQAGPRKRLRVRTQVSVGDPATEIMKTANREGSELIVLGTQGLSGADRLLLGSTARKLLCRTTRPVLAVPGGAMKISSGPHREWTGARIVAAVDLERPAAREVANAGLIAAWFRRPLLLAHVITRLAVPARVGGRVMAHA